MFCPSAVVGTSFIKTAMTCSQTGGMEGGAEGVINVGMVSGGLVGGVEASGAGDGPEGVSGDTSPLGVVDMVVGIIYRVRPGSREGSKKFVFFIRVKVGTLGRGRWGVDTVRPSVVESHDGLVMKQQVANGGHKQESRN